jgi:hypothetical protein
MPRWWEWLGRILWTLLTMGAVGLVVFVLGYALATQFVIPPTVSDFDAQVVEPSLIVLVIAGVVSFASGVAFWHRYPSTLRRRGIGWGSD